LGSGGTGKKTQLQGGLVPRLGRVSSRPKNLYTGFFGWCAGSLRPISCPCRSKDSSFSFTKTRSLRKVFFWEFQHYINNNIICEEAAKLLLSCMEHNSLSVAAHMSWWFVDNKGRSCSVKHSKNFLRVLVLLLCLHLLGHALYLLWMDFHPCLYTRFSLFPGGKL